MSSHGDRKAHRERKKAAVARTVLIQERMEKYLKEILAHARYCLSDTTVPNSNWLIVEELALEGLRKVGF